MLWIILEKNKSTFLSLLALKFSMRISLHKLFVAVLTMPPVIILNALLCPDVIILPTTTPTFIKIRGPNRNKNIMAEIKLCTAKCAEFLSDETTQQKSECYSSQLNLQGCMMYKHSYLQLFTFKQLQKNTYIFIGIPCLLLSFSCIVMSSSEIFHGCCRTIAPWIHDVGTIDNLTVQCKL